MSDARCRIVVEGKVDMLAISQILMCRKINPKGKAGRRVQVVSAAENEEEEDPGGGVSRLFEKLKVEEQNARTSGQVIGYVADADEDAHARYAQIRDRLKEVDLTVPSETDSGFLERSAGGAWLGGWVMPDNTTSGSLETMLLAMRSGTPALIEHASAATQIAFELNPFDRDQRPQGLKEVDLAKAELHAYLAWHRKPSLNFGMSFQRKRLDADSSAADGFVEWVERLLARAEA